MIKILWDGEGREVDRQTDQRQTHIPETDKLESDRNSRGRQTGDIRKDQKQAEIPETD